jgi:hypothetical protein
MSLRGAYISGRAGSDHGGDTSNYNSNGSNNLLNTPLANTMKKVGINPNLNNNRLNQFLVKKGSNNNTSNNNTYNS